MSHTQTSGLIPHHWHVRVYYEDTDCGGVVYHTAYLRFMERARTEWLRSFGFDQQHLATTSDRLFMVRGLTIEYSHPATLDEELTINSTVQPWGRLRMLFHQTARHTDGGVCCHARVEVVCVRASDNRPCSLPESLRSELTDVR